MTLLGWFIYGVLTAASVGVITQPNPPSELPKALITIPEPAVQMYR